MQETLAQGLVEASPDALWLIALDGSTLYGNARLEALLRRTVEELVALGPASALVVSRPEDLAVHEKHVGEMRAHHPGRQNDEVIAERPDGTQVWLMVSWAPYHDQDGALVGYLHRLTEYTERRELLDRLSQRESELASAQTIAQLGSWYYDVATGSTTWSSELYRIYGLDPQTFEPSYENFLARAHPEDGPRVRALIEECLQHGTCFTYEGRIVTPQGEWRWLRSNGVLTRDATGAPAILNGTCQDITDLRRAGDEAELARYRLMLLSKIADAANASQTLGEALERTQAVLSDIANWRVVSVWSRPDPRGEPQLVVDLKGSGDADLDVAEVSALASWHSDEVTIDEWPEHGRLVVWVPVRLAATTIRLVQITGRVTQVDGAVQAILNQVVSTLSRVAEREQAAAQLAAARDDAMAASAHKSAFLATMSHEIRTPMNGVIGLNDLLLRTDLDAHQRRLAEGLQGAGLTLLALINDILDLSKIESGTVELEHEPFEVVHILDQTATIITPPAQEKRLELVITCDADVPRVVTGDRVRLGQVLTNLASNAVKFTEHGEVVVRLCLDEQSEPGRIMLRGEVRDTGIGIGAHASELFEAFTQADHSTTRNHGGTGLGLTISRRLVSEMGGSIGADQRPGGGSVFWFVVPVDPAPDSTAAPSLSWLGQRRALVVDDNDAAAAALARQLADWGLDVTCFGGASEAVPALLEAAATGAAYDLALIDLHMPDVDGLALAVAVRAHPALGALPMILLSDDPSTPCEDASAVGFARVVAKPLRAAEVHHAVLEATSDARLRSDSSRGAASMSHPGHPGDANLALHVLVVEDNPVNQLVAQGILHGIGCSSVVAANGEEAVAALAPGHRFDLVLMDCRMPRMDGYVATALIRAREHGARVPIIAMTASALAGERARCLAAGMDDFLTKPVDATVLSTLIAQWSRAETATHAPPADHPHDPAVALAPAPAHVEPVLDHARVEVLDELVRDGVSFFERTRTSFLSRIDSTLSALRQAQAADDLEEIVNVAHQLRGSALNIGLTRAGTIAGELEHAASARDRPTTTSAFARLETAVHEGVQALVAFEVAHHVRQSSP